MYFTFLKKCSVSYIQVSLDPLERPKPYISFVTIIIRVCGLGCSMEIKLQGTCNSKYNVVVDPVICDEMHVFWHSLEKLQK